MIIEVVEYIDWVKRDRYKWFIGYRVTDILKRKRYQERGGKRGFGFDAEIVWVFQD